MTTSVIAPTELTPEMLEAACVAAQDGVGCTPWNSPSFDSPNSDPSARELVREYITRAYRAAVAARPRTTETTGGKRGWLIKSSEGKWIWTGTRIAAVAALTEGLEVIDLAANPNAADLLLPRRSSRSRSIK